MCVVRFPTLAGTLEVRAGIGDRIPIQELIVRLAKQESCAEMERVCLQVLEGHHAGYVITINGRSIRSLQGLATPVGDGDVVSVFPLVAGG